MNKQYHFCETHKTVKTRNIYGMLLQGFQLEPVAGEIRRLFHVNSPPTFLCKLPQFFFWEILNAETRNVFE